MREVIQDRMLAYGTRLSARAGDTVDVMVSAPTGRVSAEIVRLTGAERPGQPITETVDWDGEGSYAASVQALHYGTSVDVDEFGPVTHPGLEFSVCPTRIPDGRAGLIVAHNEAWGLWLDGADIIATLPVDGASVELRLPNAVRAGQWSKIELLNDSSEGQVLLRACGCTEYRSSSVEHAVTLENIGTVVLPPSSIRLGAAGSPAESRAHFVGKMSGPHLTSARGSGPRETVAHWDFAAQPSTQTAIDRGPQGLHGRLVNRPMRAVTGPAWDGTQYDHRYAPAHYDAMLFHDDALGDAGWQPTFTVTVAPGWEPGVYAIRLSDGPLAAEVPLYVRPQAGDERSVVFIAPTNTYLAYANERTALDETGSTLTEMKDQPLTLSDEEQWIMAHPGLGLSLYDLHSDGRGNTYSSRLRPIMNWSSTNTNWLNGAARHFAADLYLVGLLEREGIPFDVVTDEDLDREGIDLLKRYKVALTGSHPEYASGAMLDAIEQYVANGGRFMYLGGNGYYWVTSYLDDTRTAIEVRRGFKGNGNWISEPGEQFLSSTGEPGGLWRWRGRSPHKVFGVGMGSCGWAAARPYVRTEAGNGEAWSWVFAGLDVGELIGDRGYALGGAAGDEMDRVDFGVGSPADVVVLATACGFTDHYQPVIEDFINFEGNRGGSVNPNVRADMTMLPVSGGGAVFSVGSICWIAALPIDEYKNGVARVTLNVLRGFLGSGGEWCSHGSAARIGDI